MGVRRPTAPHARFWRSRGILSGIGLLVVLTVAATLRLGWPGINSFSYDEARVSWLALRMAREGEWTRVGIQSSAGVPNFPATVWIFALPYLFSNDPLVATLFVGGLAVLAVAAVWWLAARAWGAWAGFVAGLLFASSPWAVLYARSIWGQDLLLSLSVFWALAGVVGVSQERRWLLGLHVFLAGFAPQVHYAGVALIPATTWLILRYRLWRHWIAILGGVVLALICALPFAYTILCCAPQVLGALRGAFQQTPRVDGTAARQLWEMGTGGNWEWLLLGTGWTWPSTLATAMGVTRWVLALLIVIGMGVILAEAWRKRKIPRADDDAQGTRIWAGVLTNLVPVWAISSLLVFLRHSTPVYHQYQLAALPALFLCAGAAMALSSRRTWGMAMGIVVLALTVVQSVPVARGLSEVAVRLTPGGIGTPLGSLRAATRALMDGKPIIVHAHSDAPAFSGDAAGLDVLLWDYPHRIVDGRSVLLLPDLALPGSAAHLVATFPDLPAWVEAQALGLTSAARAFPRREGEPPYVAATLQEVQLSGFHAVEPLRLANGAQLRGWRVRQVEGHMRFITWWKLAGPLVSADYHQFNHLRRGLEGDPLAIRDVPLSARAWHVGDDLVTWVDFDQTASPTSLWVDVGMYTWPDVQRIAVVGRGGDPLAPIRLGPIAP